MTLNDLKGIKYYIGYALCVIAFFIYSGMVGWKWFNTTTTQEDQSNGTHRGTGRTYMYHK